MYSNRHFYLFESTVQAVLFHYGVSNNAVKILAHNNFIEVVDFQLADPDAEDKKLYSLMQQLLPGAFDRFRIKLAIHRLCRPDPMAAVPSKCPRSPTPPRFTENDLRNMMFIIFSNLTLMILLNTRKIRKKKLYSVF